MYVNKTWKFTDDNTDDNVIYCLIELDEPVFGVSIM